MTFNHNPMSKKLELEVTTVNGDSLQIYSFESGTVLYHYKNGIRITEEQFNSELAHVEQVTIDLKL